MTDLSDALSSYTQKFFGYVKRRYRSSVNWLERRKYRSRSKYRVYRDYVKNNVSVYGKAYGKYGLFEYLPFVVAYGLMVNFPGSVLLGWSLTTSTVLSYGVVSYLVVYDVQPMFKELLAEIG